jgi:hypothetical protein
MAKQCRLLCTSRATYSEKDGLYCDVHGQAAHNLRRKQPPCFCEHCLQRAEMRGRRTAKPKTKASEPEIQANVD